MDVAGCRHESIRDWRPYCNGHWERTEDGWYWVSDEPWGWATYHYGRWDFDPAIGWYWVPQTQWAPPGFPGARAEAMSVGRRCRQRRGSTGIGVVVEEPSITAAGYVFVEERRFMEPVQPKTVVVNNTTIINKTINITNVKVVNKTVINEGPRTALSKKPAGVPCGQCRFRNCAATAKPRSSPRTIRENRP